MYLKPLKAISVIQRALPSGKNVRNDTFRAKKRFYLYHRLRTTKKTLEEEKKITTLRLGGLTHTPLPRALVETHSGCRGNRSGSTDGPTGSSLRSRGGGEGVLDGPCCPCITAPTRRGGVAHTHRRRHLPVKSKAPT